jgi:hypothetical protein
MSTICNIAQSPMLMPEDGGAIGQPARVLKAKFSEESCSDSDVFLLE